MTNDLTFSLPDVGGFLFATFKDEATSLGEQVYFGSSKDGYHWQALHNGEPVLVSEQGERGVRDPFLLRLRGAERFVLLGTDLSIHRAPDWGRAVRAGSRSLVIWESDDLIHWSAPRLVPVAAEDAGCSWAPEAIYDEATGEYLVFWASTNARDDFAKHRIWASRTPDFQHFGAPFVYIDKPHDVIDTNIVHDRGRYYRFSKDEKFKTILLECADELEGDWQEVPDFSLASLVGYEGPQCFALGGGRWCLILDNYAQGRGYQAFVTDDLASGRFEPADDFSFPFPFRHGSVLPVTPEEMIRIQGAWGSSSRG